jgi:hypothetical protein
MEEGFMDMTVMLIISNLVCVFYCSHLARHKGLSEGKWALGGFFFGVIALLALVGMPKKEVQ